VVEAAEGPARLYIRPDEPSSGEKCLKVIFGASNRTRFLLRREVKMDLTLMDYFVLDVYAAPEKPMAVSLGLMVGPSLKLYEAPPVEIKTGWNYNVTFDLHAEYYRIGGKGSNAYLFDCRDDVRRMCLIFYRKENKTGTVYVDNLRFVGRPEKGWEKILPRIISVKPSVKAVKLYETLELSVDFDAVYGSYFDPDDLELSATFVGPDGRKVKVAGFFSGLYTEERKGSEPADEAAQMKPLWLIRFTPTKSGRWEYSVTVKNTLGESTSETLRLDCGTEAASKGFIRRSGRDSRCFEFTSGAFYYPLGQNVCWAGDYEYYFKKMRDNGENFVRIWMCPWNLMLEPPPRIGEYDLEAAQELDKVLRLARKYGLYVQLVLEHHGMLNSQSWSRNAYNAANGGPCASPMDFFVDPDARKLFKRRLRYIASRWGHSTNIFAWELINEADLAESYCDRDVINWHNEMAAYLRSVDPYAHPITTSTYGTELAKGLNRVSRIDFVQRHVYTMNIIEAVQKAYTETAVYGKPAFVGEFGAGTRPEIDIRDPRGVILHAGLWAAFMTPAAGSAMPWWWDTLIDPQNLYYHWKALAAFADGVDRRGKNYKQVKLAVDLGEDKKLEAVGLLAQTELLLWVYDPDRIQRYDVPDRSFIPGGTYFWLVGMPDGEYDIEFWNPYEGKIVHKLTRKSCGGRVQIVFPESKCDMACKVKFKGRLVSPALVKEVDAKGRAPDPFDGRVP